MRTHKGYFKPRNPQKYKGNPTNIVYRSGWEAKLMSYFDTHDDVVWWQSEEIAIPYISPVDNRRHRYFPDFLIHTKSGETVLIEVKPMSQVKAPVKKEKVTPRYIKEVLEYGKNISKWNAAEAYCKMKGWKFQVMTEKQIFGNK